MQIVPMLAALAAAGTLLVLGAQPLSETLRSGGETAGQNAAVNTTAKLLTALKDAKPGATIELAPGVYRDVKIQGVKFEDKVTIRGEGVVFADLLVRNSAGLKFENLEFQIQPEGLANQFQVLNSDDIHFANLDVHGPLNVAPPRQQGGLLLRNSTRLSVKDSKFHQLTFGLSVLDCIDVEAMSNTFLNLQTDGVRGGGVSKLRIADNHFTDFFPAPGDHPDGIQLWTTRTTAAAHDIVITGNVIVRGKGAAIQGIFLRDERDTLPYRNVTISDNLVLGTMWNGVTVDGGENVEISRNTVIGFPDMKSWIRLENITGGLVADNRAQQYMRIGKLSNVKEQRNATVGAARDGGASALRAWKAAPPAP